MKIPERWGDWSYWRPWLGDRAAELAASVLFLTRIPLAGAKPASDASIAQAAWAFPLAGVLVGVVGALVYGLAHWARLPAWPAAALSVAAAMAVTGCLHEDGLADTADGFGGGETREQKLDIMRDSRIGAYGVCALAISVLLRVSALASLADAGLVAAALIAAHGTGRAMMPLLMDLLPPARPDGLSFAAGRPSRAGIAAAGALGLLMLVGGLGPARAATALILLLVVLALVARLSLKQIGGQTGDVLGALEQVSEIVVLLVALRG